MQNLLKNRRVVLGASVVALIIVIGIVFLLVTGEEEEPVEEAPVVEGAPAEGQKDFLARVARTLIGAFVRNNFYELFKKVSPKTLEDVDSFVFRLAKKYTDIKAVKPEAGITTYQDGGGNIQLKEK